MYTGYEHRHAHAHFAHTREQSNPLRKADNKKCFSFDGAPEREDNGEVDANAHYEPAFPIRQVGGPTQPVSLCVYPPAMPWSSVHTCK
eukprot:scaffold45685_cov18-Tisochrysis_lutea.AAC.1